MDLYIIRHAESANNAKPVDERVAEPPITDIGVQQAKYLAKRLQHINPTRIFVSPFLRTLQTLEPYLEMTHVVPEVWIDLHEQGGSVAGQSMENFEGRPGFTGKEILAAYPNMILPDVIDHEGWWKSKPYETIQAGLVRAERVARQIRTMAHEDRVVLISHGMFMQLLNSKLLGLHDGGEDPYEDIANTAVTKFTVTESYMRLGLHNCVRHLPKSLITGLSGDHLHFDLPIEQEDS